VRAAELHNIWTYIVKDRRPTLGDVDVRDKRRAYSKKTIGLVMGEVLAEEIPRK
jgi:hypothetical protein